LRPAPEIPRPALLDALAACVRDGGPCVLGGPIGSGKTTLLRRLAATLDREGWTVVYLDLMGAASCPERFVAAALDALPAERFADRLPQALEIRRVAASGRAHGCAAVQGVFNLFRSLDTDALGRRVAVLLDEATEIRSLAYFEGLRKVAEPFAGALNGRARGTLLATSFPSLAHKLWGWPLLDAAPLSAADLAPWLPEGVAQDLLRVSFGWPRYVGLLLEALARGDGVAPTWTREMSPGGRLEQACRYSYESLLLRSRGYGMSKALLGAVAHAEGANLTALCREFGRSPGATRDYLGWLLGVDALRMVRKRYYYVDGLLRQWVRLYARGRLPAAHEIERIAHELLGAAGPADAPAPTDAPASLDAATPRPRGESLIEID
jgi:hypothetical protein